MIEIRFADIFYKNYRQKDQQMTVTVDGEINETNRFSI